MRRWLAVAAYQCRINGVVTGSVDVRVRNFNLPSPTDVAAMLTGEPAQEYPNEHGEKVSWPLAHIFEIAKLRRHTSGDEVIGFIADADESARLDGMPSA